MKKKIDTRIKSIIESNVQTRHRSLFVIIGDNGKDQALVSQRPSVLWCYKKELGFSSHKKKRMKQIKKKAQTGVREADQDDPFELFISSTEIRYTYYDETEKILGNTFGMCVLQDFEAITPNVMARTIETVQGGGIIVLILNSMKSLKQLYTMSMDAHSRYRTEAHHDVVARFNERFLLSLVDCKNCLIVDDRLNVLPITNQIATFVGADIQEKRDMSDFKKDIDLPSTKLTSACLTFDQASVVKELYALLESKSLSCTVSLTAARGRGKSAALGLSLAAAISMGYSNIFVTSPSPENLKTLFQFLFKGFDALGYEEHLDYDIIQSSNADFNKAVIRVNVFKSHRQTIQYIRPQDQLVLGQAELLVIDEAAAIPLPIVKKLLGPYMIFLASTINGYEGTGRSLSLKLISQLRSLSSTRVSQEGHLQGLGGRSLKEVQLEEPIRYAAGDPIEQWLNGLLCLNAATCSKSKIGCPHPSQCDLFWVNRDTLFSYHKASESFLQKMMALYVSSHYKNSPNDLQLMSDAPAHHLFVLLPPVDENAEEIPEILCVLQVSLEGQVSKESILASLSRGKRGAGDLIPWTISQQFQDDDFPVLSGARVVRIAVHPEMHGMGYGTRALKLLEDYYFGRIICSTEGLQDDELPRIEDSEIEESLESASLLPRKSLPPLLSKLSEIKPIQLDWIGVSFGLTQQLHKFWKKADYLPVYLRQTTVLYY